MAFLPVSDLCADFRPIFVYADNRPEVEDSFMAIRQV